MYESLLVKLDPETEEFIPSKRFQNETDMSITRYF